MGKIIILDENTINKIAAGEVIERPSSVVKELVENSIDAGADRISVEIKNGGISFIKVSDNGSGIDDDDVEISFERHSTSKIRRSDDLSLISTLGFRGEALASIAAVSAMQLSTRTKENSHGIYAEISAGVIKEVKQAGCPIGTSITVRNLFFNTPARYKFLKKDSSEAGYISDIIGRIALGKPNIAFKFINSGSVDIQTPGNGDIRSVIYSIYGKETASNVFEVCYKDQYTSIYGFTGKPEISRSNRNHQSLYVNGRYVKSKLFSSAVEEAYKTYLMIGKFPFYVLNLDINPALIDVNVHPTKMELRFSNEHEIFRSVYNAILSTLSKLMEIRTPLSSLEERKPKFYGKTIENNVYTQEPIIDGFLKVNEAPLTDTAEFVNIYSEKTSSPIDETVTASRENEMICDNICKREIISPDSRIIGQLFSTYILLQQEEDFIMIDQHAAHERVMYERLLAKYNAREPFSQILAVPVNIELTLREFKFAMESIDFFENICFKYESFGNNSIMLREVPFLDNELNYKQLFMDLIDAALSDEKKSKNLVADEMLYTIACKAAIKANKKMADLEIRELIKELSCMENPFSCPHGRPTAVRITRRDIEKMFKRIV